MNELIDKFCGSRRRWLIVTTVTGVLGLLTVLPLVDQYSTLCNENSELGDQLGEAQRIAAALPRFEQRVDEKLQELNQIDGQTVPEESVGAFRNKLIDFARETGCRVSRISVGVAEARPWRLEDNALETDPEEKEKETPFVLETRPVTLSITGPLNSVKQLLSRVQADSTMQHVKFFELRATGRDRQSVQLDVELWCYALNRGSA